MKILHVTECFEGGVSRAIQSIVEASPQHEHHLLAVGADLTADWVHGFASLAVLRDGIVARTRHVRASVRKGRFDVVHAHSSWAGLYARAVRLPAEVVYQPHCFATEMNVGARRFLFGAVERLLGIRRQTVVVLSPREAHLARAFSPRARVQFVPNAPSVDIASPRRRPKDATTVVTAGRISEQKDPSFFVAVAEKVRDEVPRARFVWIGGGSADWKESFERTGVTVTGWLGPHDLVGHLDAADVYFHTAAWEGFPLSVLDASARGLPVVVRNIPAFQDLDLVQIEDVDGAASTLVELLSRQDRRDANTEATESALGGMNHEGQRRSLAELYDALSPERRASRDRTRGIG